MKDFCVINKAYFKFSTYANNTQDTSQSMRINYNIVI